MAEKRKASDDAASEDDPRSLRPPKARRGFEDEGSSLRDYSVDSSGGSDIADMLVDLSIPSLNHDPVEEEKLAAAAEQAHSQPQDDQPTEMDVQLPPPAIQSGPPPEVADQSVAAAAPVPGVVTPAADSVRCSGCGSEPASVCLVPVEHACLCLPCGSSLTGRPHCEFCDGPRR